MISLPTGRAPPQPDHNQVRLVFLRRFQDLVGGIVATDRLEDDVLDPFLAEPLVDALDFGFAGIPVVHQGVAAGGIDDHQLGLASSGLRDGLVKGRFALRCGNVSHNDGHGFSLFLLNWVR